MIGVVVGVVMITMRQCNVNWWLDTVELWHNSSLANWLLWPLHCQHCQSACQSPSSLPGHVRTVQGNYMKFNWNPKKIIARKLPAITISVKQDMWFQRWMNVLIGIWKFVMTWVAAWLLALIASGNSLIRFACHIISTLPVMPDSL